MNRHILVTVGRDSSALFGLRFVSSFFQDKSRVSLTLFSTAASPLPLPASAGVRERTQHEAMRSKRERQCRESLDKARAYCLASGFSEDHIRSKQHFHKLSTAMDIVREAERGLYDAVVLGSRGLSWLEEFMADSVSKETLDARLTIPLWVCRKPAFERRHVLACVDDSEQSFRMVDHVAFILENEPSQHVTLVNVYDPHSGDRVFADALFERCEHILTHGGLEKGRIRRRYVEDYNVARAILGLAARDRFAAVAAGRTGEDKGFLRRVFMGSVSGALFHQLTGSALWLCQ